MRGKCGKTVVSVGQEPRDFLGLALGRRSNRISHSADRQAALVALPWLMLGIMLVTKTVRALNRAADRPCPERAVASYRSDAPFATRAGALNLICRASPLQNTSGARSRDRTLGDPCEHDETETRAECQQGCEPR